MAKSKLAQGIQKIEKNVVGTYEKIEGGVVGSFQKMSDKFVDNYLTREGESVEDAKVRIATEQKRREDENRKYMEDMHQMQNDIVKKSLEESLNAGRR